MKNTKGFTLLEVLMVLAILSLISLIALPSINESRKNAQVEQLKSEMITNLYDLQNYLSEKEAINDSYIVDGAQFYNSPYYSDNDTLKNIVKEVFTEFPEYLAVEVVCDEDSTGKHLKISISYPGYGSDGVTRIKNISESELAQGYYGGYDSEVTFNDISGCTWEAYNSKQISLPDDESLIVSKIATTLKVYDISNVNNHVILTLQHLADLRR